MMIIQRAIRSLRAHDWPTVMIELLVVIVGIFLGLQVDDWNDARKESLRETAYLQRLKADIDEMISQHEAHEERATSRLQSLFVSFDALHTCTLDPEAVKAFEFSLLGHQALQRLVVARSSFDEMVASGALAGIDDPVLKKSISEVYSEAVAVQQFIEYFSADLGRASDIIWNHVSFDLKASTAARPDSPASWVPGRYSQSVSYNFEDLCNSAAFKNAMVEIFDSTEDRLSLGAELAAQLRVLRGLIDARLEGE